MSLFGLPSAGYQAAPAGMYSAFQRFSSCLMHAGFKRIAIERGSGLNLNDPWITPPDSIGAGEVLIKLLDVKFLCLTPYDSG
jgi:hypothetical protein